MPIHRYGPACRGPSSGPRTWPDNPSVAPLAVICRTLADAPISPVCSPQARDVANLPVRRLQGDQVSFPSQPDRLDVRVMRSCRGRLRPGGRDDLKTTHPGARGAFRRAIPSPAARGADHLHLAPAPTLPRRLGGTQEPSNRDRGGLAQLLVRWVRRQDQHWQARSLATSTARIFTDADWTSLEVCEGIMNPSSSPRKAGMS